MLNFQHLTKSRSYETLKRVQGDISGLFTRPSYFDSVAFPVLVHFINRLFSEYRIEGCFYGNNLLLPLRRPGTVEGN